MAIEAAVTSDLIIIEVETFQKAFTDLYTSFKRMEGDYLEA